MDRQAVLFSFWKGYTYNNSKRRYLKRLPKMTLNVRFQGHLFHYNKVRILSIKTLIQIISCL
jgi:hypothetical protein